MTYKYDETSPSCLTRNGKPAGWQDPRGYWKATAKCLYAHRIIWEMLKGPIPDGMVIDHINQDKSNNRIENLRCVTYGENNGNVGVRAHCMAGHKYIHVCPKTGRFIFLYKSRRYANCATLEEALAARDAHFL